MPRLVLFPALILVGILSFSGSAPAADNYLVQKRPRPDSNIMAADALVGRPVGLGATILGTGTFIATLPFSACARSVKDAARGLIKEPAAWTFKRPLGEPPKDRKTFIIR